VVTLNRRLGIATTLVGIAVGATVMGGATPASADTRIADPADGAVVTGPGVTIRASADLFAGRLLLNGTKVAESQGALRHQINTHEVRNGTYKAVLEQRGLTGLFWHHKDEVTFTVRAAPRVPADTKVGVKGRDVTLRWRRGTEPDLLGYEVTSAKATRSGSRDGGAASSRVAERDTADKLCSGPDCSATIDVPSTVAGTMVFGVRARRATGSGGAVRSDAAEARVTFPAGGGPGSVSGSGATGDGSGAAGPDELGQLPGRSLALPRVPPGGAANGFQYPTPEPEVAAPPGVDAENASGTTPEPAVSLALALVILLGATHLGMWMRRRRFAHASSGAARSGPATSSGKAAAASTGAKGGLAMVRLSRRGRHAGGTTGKARTTARDARSTSRSPRTRGAEATPTATPTSSDSGRTGTSAPAY
jgi:hypothetical protein